MINWSLNTTNSLNILIIFEHFGSLENRSLVLKYLFQKNNRWLKIIHMLHFVVWCSSVTFYRVKSHKLVILFQIKIRVEKLLRDVAFTDTSRISFVSSACSDQQCSNHSKYLSVSLRNVDEMIFFLSSKSKDSFMVNPPRKDACLWIELALKVNVRLYDIKFKGV